MRSSWCATTSLAPPNDLIRNDPGVNSLNKEVKSTSAEDVCKIGANLSRVTPLLLTPVM